MFLIHPLKDYDADDSEVYDNVIYINGKAQQIESLAEESTVKEQADRESSSESEFIDSLDTVHETAGSNLNVPACSIVKSNSFSGVTEREILRSKIKELYNLYNNTNHDTMSSSLQEIQLQKKNNSETITGKNVRAGKYNKKVAPDPPRILDPSGSSAIKATLVLKPGIVKTLLPLTNNSKSEIFLSHSPKPKRKSKLNSPISRLMMLPKKMVFWNKEDTTHDKRFSWNMFSGSHKETIPFSKQYSKSHEDLQNTCKFYDLCDEDLLSYNSIRKEDHFRVRKLSASPTISRKIERAKTELELD